MKGSNSIGFINLNIISAKLYALGAVIRISNIILIYPLVYFCKMVVGDTCVKFPYLVQLCHRLYEYSLLYPVLFVCCLYIWIMIARQLYVTIYNGLVVKWIPPKMLLFCTYAHVVVTILWWLYSIGLLTKVIWETVGCGTYRC